MAKRFTDTDKWKKGFIKTLEAPYKLLWLYILDECDHAGIWHAEIEVAQLRLGIDITEAEALEAFSDKIERIDGGEKWFIRDFIEFQYGSLNPENRAHNSVIERLKKVGIDIKSLRPLTSPLQAPVYGAMDMDKDKDKEGECEGELSYVSFVNFWNQVNECELRMTPKKREQVRSRLKRFSEDEIKQAIQNRAVDDWINSEGLKFKTDWQSFWANDEKVERYLNKKPKSQKRVPVIDG